MGQKPPRATAMTTKERRTQSIKIRLTPSELAELKKRQVGDELATWVRQLCLGEPLQSPPKRRNRKEPPKADTALLVSLARIGNNLNQLAKQANTLDDVARLQAFADLAVIQNQLDVLLQTHVVGADDDS